MRAFVLLTSFCLSCSAILDASDLPELPSISGIVTRVASPGDFDVDGVHVMCDPKVVPDTMTGILLGCPKEALHLGQRVDVYGRYNRKRGVITAQQLDVKALNRDSISGTAVIDAVLRTDANSVEVRTDGYPILITPKTAVTFYPPIQSLSDVMTNVWIEYKAKPRADGLFVAQEARLFQNIVTDKEDSMLKKTDYDPTTIPSDAKRRRVVASTIGPNPKQMAPWPDQAMQSRVAAIGAKLVPAYQHQLAANDPSKINFRFSGDDWGRLAQRDFAAERDHSCTPQDRRTHAERLAARRDSGDRDRISAREAGLPNAQCRSHKKDCGTRVRGPLDRAAGSRRLSRNQRGRNQRGTPVRA